MSEQKTLAEIIAEMRALSNPISDGVIAINGRSIADRLEAAHKRERGDCAKLREALENMVRAETYGSMKRDDLCGLCLEKMFARCKHDGTCWVDKAITALAAPPRNCDVYDSYGDAIRAFEDDENAEGYEDMAEWLFAPATEKEGGAK